MTEKKLVQITLIGSGGDGIMSTASMILRVASQMGFYGMMTQSYGLQIRGGESAAHLSFGVRPVRVVTKEKDLFVCFRFSDALRFQKELSMAPHGILFHGAAETVIPSILQSSQGSAVLVDFTEALQKAGLPEISKNIFVLGIILKAVGWNLDIAKDCVRQVFAHKSEIVISGNIRALELGFQRAEVVVLPFSLPKIPETKSRKVLTGNEACAYAAVDAGCRFYAGYPITPSSEILETMATLLPKVDGKIIQAEDEIAALGMVVGASYGGVPSMTATSGPGLSLMTEMVGLSSMTEIPLVIVDCQRGGPSTGLPSRTEQSDLWHVVYGGHGDFPRVVLAPTDVSDCYPTMFRAFYCAENYQLPVFVLSDASIAQRAEIIDPVDATHLPHAKRLLAKPGEVAFSRFDLRSEISPMMLPGTPGGMHSIAGIEHDENGFPTADGELHEQMNRKRFKKIEILEKETASWFRTFGDLKAENALIAWGSSAGAVRELVESEPTLAAFIPEILHPFPKEGLARFLQGKRQVFVLEMNCQGQLHHYLRGIGAIEGSAISLCRSGGIPFDPKEI